MWLSTAMVTDYGQHAAPHIDRCSAAPGPVLMKCGDSAQIVVSVTGFPEPSVQWHVGSRRVKKSSGYRTSFNGREHTLTIDRVTDELEKGVWVMATNDAGEDTCLITVQTYKVLTGHKETFHDTVMMARRSATMLNRSVTCHPARPTSPGATVSSNPQHLQSDSSRTDYTVDAWRREMAVRNRMRSVDDLMYYGRWKRESLNSIDSSHPPEPGNVPCSLNPSYCASAVTDDSSVVNSASARRRSLRRRSRRARSCCDSVASAPAPMMPLVPFVTQEAPAKLVNRADSTDGVMETISVDGRKPVKGRRKSKKSASSASLKSLKAACASSKVETEISSHIVAAERLPDTDGDVFVDDVGPANTEDIEQIWHLHGIPLNILCQQILRDDDAWSECQPVRNCQPSVNHTYDAVPETSGKPDHKPDVSYSSQCPLSIGEPQADKELQNILGSRVPRIDAGHSEQWPAVTDDTFDHHCEISNVDPDVDVMLELKETVSVVDSITRDQNPTVIDRQKSVKSRKKSKKSTSSTLRSKSASLELDTPTNSHVDMEDTMVHISENKFPDKSPHITNAQSINWDIFPYDQPVPSLDDLAASAITSDADAGVNGSPDEWHEVSKTSFDTDRTTSQISSVPVPSLDDLLVSAITDNAELTTSVNGSPDEWHEVSKTSFDTDRTISQSSSVVPDTLDCKPSMVTSLGDDDTTVLSAECAVTCSTEASVDDEEPAHTGQSEPFSGSEPACKDSIVFTDVNENTEKGLFLSEMVVMLQNAVSSDAITVDTRIPSESKNGDVEANNISPDDGDSDVGCVHTDDSEHEEMSACCLTDDVALESVDKNEISSHSDSQCTEISVSSVKSEQASVQTHVNVTAPIRSADHQVKPSLDIHSILSQTANLQKILDTIYSLTDGKIPNSGNSFDRICGARSSAPDVEQCSEVQSNKSLQPKVCAATKHQHSKRTVNNTSVDRHSDDSIDFDVESFDCDLEHVANDIGDSIHLAVGEDDNLDSDPESDDYDLAS